MQTTGNNNFSEISLYFHIPFCTRKCDYCHFYVIPDHELHKQQLAEGFRLEWERIYPLVKDHSIRSLYFGGGTPFLYGSERLSQLISRVKKGVVTTPHCEITLEANPENVSLLLMQAYKDAGVNRVSLGIQTLDHHLLQLLGRLHRPKTALDAIDITYDAGIHNISLDLMYDLPGQTLSHWEETLRSVLKYPITHLSLYNLTIEPHTVFFKKQKQLRPQLPSEEISLAMYEMAIAYLEDAGLKQYEISAFAKPGFESQHNSGYWTGRSFLGLGPSAFSFWNKKRFSNIANLNRYCQLLAQGHSPIDFEEKLTDQASRLELFICQIRLCCGVDLNQFQLINGQLGQDTFHTLQRLQNQELIERKGPLVKLTKKGILFYDHVAVELI